MENKKSLLDILLNDYDWRTMTNNYNEQKMLEVVNSLGSNATKRLMVFICMTESANRGEVDMDFMIEWQNYYEQQQLAEILKGRNVALDYDEILQGADKDSRNEFMFGYAEWLQSQLCLMNQDRPVDGFHVENINNYGYISDVLNQYKKKNDLQELE